MRIILRKCDACGGRGFPFGITHDSNYEPCPVCLGSGRISDVMPAKEACRPGVQPGNEGPDVKFMLTNAMNLYRGRK